GPRRRARAAGPRDAPAPGHVGAARHPSNRRADARHPGNVVPGDRRRAAAARRHREVAHQPRPHRAGAAGAQAARRRVRRPPQSRETDGSLLMNVTTAQLGGVWVVRVGETRLMYPILSDFSSAVGDLIAAGNREILIDLSPVTYVDSATI